MDTYVARYFDAHGAEDTTITNDGTTLRMTLRDVEFAGTDFDSLEPNDAATQDQLAKFTLNHNELCSCRIECEVPIPINDHGSQSQGTLFVDLTVGDPEPKGWLDLEVLRLRLTTKHGEFVGSGKSGWFEDELLEIQSQLPEAVYMQACINCLYSDYSPYGHGAFGYMICFRNLKSEYLAVKSKDDFWAVHNCYDRIVQETFVCPEFARRVPGTGYRG